MYRKDCWPFSPTHLSEVIPLETLQVLESGSCERIKRSLTILDRIPDSNHFTRIDPITARQRFEPFCQLLRDDPECEMLCRAMDIAEANKSFQVYKESGDRYREFRCHMGLIDMTCLITIHNNPLAIVYSGQYCPPDGFQQVHQAVRRFYELSTSDDNFAAVQKLYSLADKLQPIQENARFLLEKEADHIQRIATIEFERQKRMWEEEFFDRLQSIIKEIEPLDRVQFTESIQSVLQKIKDFCQARYLIFFGSVLENDYLLAPIAHIGAPSEVAKELPHFNWRKAGLPVSQLDLDEWLSLEHVNEAREKGIRGAHSDFFRTAACILPFTLADRFRGVFIFGPFSENIDLQAEKQFLTELANLAGSYALTGLQVQYLQQERQRWQSTARLLTHQVNTALTPINTQIGRALAILDRKGGGMDTHTMREFLQQSEDLVLNLARSAKQTLKGYIELAQPEDLSFQAYQLPILVGNTVSGFIETAKARDIEIITENSIDYLPEADVDIARLTIAIANLLDNAIKYSYPGTKIYIRAYSDPYDSLENKRRHLEIDNLGYEIRQEELDKIFERGVRGQAVNTPTRVGGTGYGLWEARSILRAHGGDIRAVCTPIQKIFREGRAFHTIFTLEIPLRQKHLQGGGYAKSSG